MCCATIASIITHCMAGGSIKACHNRGIMIWAGKASEDAVEDALVVVVLARAPGVQGVRDEVEHHLHALRLRAVQDKALAQRADAARTPP